MKGNRDDPIEIDLEVSERNVEVTTAKWDSGTAFGMLASSAVLTMSLILAIFVPWVVCFHTIIVVIFIVILVVPVTIARYFRGWVYHVSVCLDCICDAGERAAIWVAFIVVLVQRDAELVRSFKYNVQEIIIPWYQTVASVGIKLCVEVLVWVFWKQAYETRRMLY
jgi:hypothetical protein